MGDVFCRKCGEPWDSFGITRAEGEGDLTAREAERFLRGEGCPSCHWGRHCKACAGTGKQPDPASGCICLGSRYLILRRLAGTGDWHYGYLPNVHVFPGEPEIIYRYPPGMSRDGPYEEVLARCPQCAQDAPDCPECHGSGELQPLDEDGLFQAVAALVEESDEDVTGYIWGLL